MTPLGRLQLRASEIRSRLSELGGDENLTDESRAEIDTLRNEYRDVETRTQALMLATDEPVVTETTSEDRALDALRGRVDFGNYLGAALEQRAVIEGPELEYNQALHLPGNRFPMEVLTQGVELRAAIDGDSQTNQGTWLDRVMAGTAAQALGVSFRNVAPGIASFPVTSAGGDPAQRGRAQAAAASTYTATITEMKGKRAAIHGVYQIEDDARLPGLSDAIRRDMAAAMVAGIDKTIFIGDSTASPNDGDVVGLTTAAIDEVTITQAQKVKGDEILKKLVALVDGIYATGLGDLRIVTTVGSNVLWTGQVHAATVENQTVAQFLRNSGIDWTTRGEIEENTANGDFGAFVGLSRGIDGAGIAIVHDSGQMIVDPYTDADDGGVRLTLNYLWDFGLPRPANFRRIKYVT